MIVAKFWLCTNIVNSCIHIRLEIILSISMHTNAQIPIFMLHINFFLTGKYEWKVKTYSMNEYRKHHFNLDATHMRNGERTNDENKSTFPTFIRLNLKQRMEKNMYFYLPINQTVQVSKRKVTYTFSAEQEEKNPPLNGSFIQYAFNLSILIMMCKKLYYT